MPRGQDGRFIREEEFNFNFSPFSIIRYLAILVLVFQCYKWLENSKALNKFDFNVRLHNVQLKTILALLVLLVKSKLVLFVHHAMDEGLKHVRHVQYVQMYVQLNKFKVKLNDNK